MHFTSALVLLLPHLATSTLLPLTQHIFTNPDPSFPTSRIPTSYESAVLGRRILHLESIGTFSTIFPAGHDHNHDSPDSALSEGSDLAAARAGNPIGLMDYFGDCEPDSGNPTILAVAISTSMRNVAAGSNISLAVQWHPGTGNAVSPASLPRFSLMGYLQEMSEDDIDDKDIDICYTNYHPDAVAWLPGNPIHRSAFTRLIVQQIYWVGGFGDRSYIGWIPVEEWRKVTRKEMDKARLPGEIGRSWKDLLMKRR
ncbi:MAG: hypothetical protein M1817_003765 [Caeruleum heppii]|nr:MAG: hypothetical protein M1817_003765 [Caeruleum heppii]